MAPWAVRAARARLTERRSSVSRWSAVRAASGPSPALSSILGVSARGSGAASDAADLAAAALAWAARGASAAADFARAFRGAAFGAAEGFFGIARSPQEVGG